MLLQHLHRQSHELCKKGRLAIFPESTRLNIKSQNRKITRTANRKRFCASYKFLNRVLGWSRLTKVVFSCKWTFSDKSPESQIILHKNYITKKNNNKLSVTDEIYYNFLHTHLINLFVKINFLNGCITVINK